MAYISVSDYIVDDFEGVIKGTKVIAVIKRMQFRGKDQTWKTDIHYKEHKVTKIIQSNKSKVVEYGLYHKCTDVISGFHYSND